MCIDWATGGRRVLRSELIVMKTIQISIGVVDRRADSGKWKELRKVLQKSER